MGVRRGDLQLFLPVNTPGRAELYDHSSDPRERRNIFSENEEDAAALGALADAYLSEAKSPWGKEPEEVELSEMQLGQLRALPYLATALAAWLQAGLLAWSLRGRGHLKLDARLRRRLPRMLLASFLMGAVLWAGQRWLIAWFEGGHGFLLEDRSAFPRIARFLTDG